MSMAVGLEVRVPFCDHRLVEYVYNAPWSLKTYDGREKSLLRGAAHDLLPQSVVERVKSPYPSTQDPQYVGAIQRQAKDLLSRRDGAVFSLVDPDWLSNAARQDPAAISPTARHGLEVTLDLAAWMDTYRPQIAVPADAAPASLRRRRSSVG
jgi:asparagine synthase (glutamine-hydrolysing)